MIPADLMAFVSPLLGSFAGGVAVYVGIRTDIARLKAQVERNEKATDQAHSRIDSILQERHR